MKSKTIFLFGIFFLLIGLAFVSAGYIRAPGVIKTEPSSNRFANGSFLIEFKNLPNSLILRYGNTKTGYRDSNVSIDNCDFFRNFDCTTSVDLSDYNDQQIFYYFIPQYTNSLTRIGQTVPTKVKVDSIPPVINNLSYTINKKIVTFDISIVEENLVSVQYMDNPISQRWINLCTRLQNSRCISRKSFSSGPHDLTVMVKDKAGNTALQEVVFDI